MHLHRASNVAIQPDGGKTHTVLGAVQHFASSYGLKPFKVIVLKDAAVINAIQSLATEQPLKTTPANILVFAIRASIGKPQIDDYIAGIVSHKRASVNSLNSYNKYLTGAINNPNQEGKNWAAKQVGLALDYVTAAAAQHNVPVTLLQGLNTDKVDSLLNLDAKQLHTVAAVSLDNAVEGAATPLAQLPEDKQLLFEYV